MILKKKIKIRNAQGLHARPASMFVQIANRFEADVTVRRGHETVNGKSIMGLMMLAATPGSTVELEVSGADADAAMTALEHFLLNDSADDNPNHEKDPKKK